MIISQYSGITHDSRQVKPGNIFVALPGDKYDGVNFIPQAIAAGAKMIVAEKEVTVPPGVEFKKVAGARRALAELACEFYGHPSRKLKVIGITGTKGKTTTAFLLQAILNQAGYKTGLLGTITHHMTTPEAPEVQKFFAQLLQAGFTHCVMEVSSHALAQQRIDGTHFIAAIFTNLSHDHLDYHKNMADYLAAKIRLFTMLDKSSLAIINVDDPASREIISVVPGEVIPYGLEQARHELRNTRYNDFDTLVQDIFIGDKEMTMKINTFEIRTPLLGMPNVYNITAAYQCALALGVNQRIIKAGIESVKMIPGRFENVNCGQAFKVVVDFAHSPDSLQKLLETYRPLTKGQLILVFGCSGDRDRAKRPMMMEIAKKIADYTIITTDDPHSEDPAVIIEEIAGVGTAANCEKVLDRKTAIHKALQLAKDGDTVLLAGRGHEKYQDFAGKAVALDDVEVARTFLCQLTGKLVL